MVEGKEVRFKGVIVGFEELIEYSSPALYVQGSIDNIDTSFYLLVPREVFNNYQTQGVGRIIEGRGLLVKRNPFIVKYLG